MVWVQAHWAEILAGLLALDKLIMLSPLKSNSMIQLLSKWLESLAKATDTTPKT